jgi:hypothetical protein
MTDDIDLKIIDKRGKNYKWLLGDRTGHSTGRMNFFVELCYFRLVKKAFELFC